MSSDDKNTALPKEGAQTDAPAEPKPTVKDKNQENYLKYRHTGGISKEFKRQIARGEDLRCTYPWNRPDIVLRDNRTKVCYDFPIRLPWIDWPTTEDFQKKIRCGTIRSCSGCVVAWAPDRPCRFVTSACAQTSGQ